MKLKNKIEKYIKNINESNNIIDKAHYLKKLNNLKNEIITEYNKRIDIIYTIYHNGQYYQELENLKEDIEKEYNCKITTENYYIKNIEFIYKNDYLIAI